MMYDFNNQLNLPNSLSPNTTYSPDFSVIPSPKSTPQSPRIPQNSLPQSPRSNQNSSFRKFFMKDND